MRISFKKSYIYAHVVIPLVISLLTLINIEGFLVLPYIVLSLLSISVITINTQSLFRDDNPKFLYLFSMLVVLGCWFKFSMYKILKLDKLREPIGDFLLGSNLENDVLWLSNVGIFALLIASIIGKKLNVKCSQIQTKNDNESKFKFVIAVTSILTVALLAYINLKYNILLFSILPEIKLPFKGNVIYFLVLTRVLPFIFLLYCLRRFNLLYIFLGSLIFSISSIGVLSRLGVLIYFLVVLIMTLNELQKWSLRDSIANITSLAAIFTFSTFLNVSLATGARDFFYEITPNPLQNKSIRNLEKVAPVTDVLSKSTAPDKFEMLKDLALGRWIGTEGVMAVVAYPDKGFNLLRDAFKEESYHGDSFYSKILNIKNSNTSKVVSTSVPGPIAFFYYSGSMAIVFIAMLVMPLIFVLIEKGLISLFGSFNPAIAMVISFFAIDYHQFGIAPLAFFKYCLFTIVSATFFGALINFKTIKLYLTQYSWPLGKN